jgi:hypothetical protein
MGIAQALGLGRGAVQLDLGLLPDDGTWMGRHRPYERGATGLRLDRYLTDGLLRSLGGSRRTAVWRDLASRHGEVRILLRRLRYRLGEDFGSEAALRRYGYWTTRTTEAWAERGRHRLEYLVYRLSYLSDDMVSGSADPADSLDPAFWGEVDTELDPLRVTQLTTASGTTAKDVKAVLAHAGRQIHHAGVWTVTASSEVNREDPLRPFIEGLREWFSGSSPLTDTDVLLIHRGGGLNPTTRWSRSNVSDQSRRDLLDLCLRARDLGIEVVVALGHANISALIAPEESVHLPLGIFEATTPTAGAAWILQEHINPRLVDTSLVYSQPSDE